MSLSCPRYARSAIATVAVSDDFVSTTQHFQLQFKPPRRRDQVGLTHTCELVRTELQDRANGSQHPGDLSENRNYWYKNSKIC